MELQIQKKTEESYSIFLPSLSGSCGIAFNNVNNRFPVVVTVLYILSISITKVIRFLTFGTLFLGNVKLR